MKKRVFSLLLILALLMSAVPAGAWAAEAPAEVYCGSLYSPLIGVELAEEPPEEEPESWYLQGRLVAASGADAEYVSPETAAVQLRDAMMRRENTVRLYVSYSGTESYEELANAVFNRATDMSIAEGATDGDYLRWVFSDGNYKVWVGEHTYIYEFHLRYYTTYQQEQEALSAMERIIAQLDLDGLTDYGKAMAIYRYVAEHVTYDHAGAAAILEQLELHDQKKDIEQHYFRPHTAYAAVMDGTAVCQGYATMLYALYRMAGLPVRIIVGSNHAWNIVQLGGIWYNLDVTTDSNRTNKTWCFLRGSTNFEGPIAGYIHQRDAEYLTPEFLAQYPVSASDYVSSTRYWDVAETNGHVENIERISQLGIMNGIDKNRPIFGPHNNMERAMLVTVLYRIEGEPQSSGPSFRDVPSGTYYTEAVTWAAANGVVQGDGDGTFRPTDSLTRQELVTILYRYAAEVRQFDVSGQADLSAYVDREQLGDWAVEPVRWSVGTGIVKGTTATELSPEDTATREQLATILMRYLTYYGLAA